MGCGIFVMRENEKFFDILIFFALGADISAQALVHCGFHLQLLVKEGP